MRGSVRGREREREREGVCEREREERERDNIVTAFTIIAAQMLIQLERLQQSLGYVCQFAARKCLCCVTYVRMYLVRLCG